MSFRQIISVFCYAFVPLVFFLFALLMSTPVAWASVGPVEDGDIVDGYRPPETEYGAGNRGWEYETKVGENVSSIGDGTVSWSGKFDGDWIVVVDHGGGLRTTYQGLEEVSYKVGDAIAKGQSIGRTAKQMLHFGARCGNKYIDPALLFKTDAVLVPLQGENPIEKRVDKAVDKFEKMALNQLCGRLKQLGKAGVDAAQKQFVRHAGKTAAQAGGRVVAQQAATMGTQTVAKHAAVRIAATALASAPPAAIAVGIVLGLAAVTYFGWKFWKAWNRK